jgi:hypothetical protein
VDRDGPVGGESASNGGEVAWRVRWRQRRVSSDLEKEGTGGGAGGPMVQLATKVRHWLCRRAAGAGWAVS